MSLAHRRVLELRRPAHRWPTVRLLRFMPETRPRYIMTADGELGLVDRERRVAPREWTHDQKFDFYGPSLGSVAGSRDGRRTSTAKKFGTWPRWGVEPPLVDPTPEVRAWVKSRTIAWAKVRRAA
jgi:hypothetical protein